MFNLVSHSGLSIPCLLFESEEVGVPTSSPYIGHTRVRPLRLWGLKLDGKMSRIWGHQQFSTQHRYPLYGLRKCNAIQSRVPSNEDVRDPNTGFNQAIQRAEEDVRSLCRVSTLCYNVKLNGKITLWIDCNPKVFKFRRKSNKEGRSCLVSPRRSALSQLIFDEVIWFLRRGGVHLEVTLLRQLHYHGVRQSPAASTATLKIWKTDID